MRTRTPQFTCPALARPLALALFALVPTTPLVAQCEDCVFPGDEWEYARGADLAALRWDAQALRQVTGHLVDASNSTGVVVVDRGRVVFTFGDVEELSYLASVRKSLLSMLYGYWVENGTIDLETKR